MKKAWLISGAALALLLGGMAAAQTPPPNPITGYIAAADMPDAARIIGPPPANGTGTKTGDVATYKATRALEGTPRWTLAVRDAEFGPGAIMREYSCAAGMALDPAAEPALLQLLRKVVADSQAIQQHAKEVYKRPRPFVENNGTFCTPDDRTILTSYSYPSGHSTYSWTVGMILADLMPDRATQIMDRARSYGESRVVCGAHYESDVQAGRVTASALFSVLQNEAQFRSDLDAARRELAARRQQPAAPDAAECTLEDDANANPVW